AESGNIGNEIRIPGSMALNLFSFPAEVTILAAKSIRKDKRVIEDKIQIPKTVDHDGRICQSDESRRLITLRVKVLAPRVERRRKHTPLLPFKGLPSACFLPNRCRATSVYDIDELFEQVTLGESFTLGRDFTNVSITPASSAQHIHEV